MELQAKVKAADELYAYVFMDNPNEWIVQKLAAYRNAGKEKV